MCVCVCVCECVCPLAKICRMFQVKSALLQDRVTLVNPRRILTFIGMMLLEICGILRCHSVHLCNMTRYPYIAQIHLSVNS
jgi:hypothetical protein